MAHSDQDIMVAVNDVSKSFVKPGKRRNPEILPVLRNINIQIKRSEFVAIVGPTGCGKTSVLRAIGGLLPIDAGAITVDGKLVTGPGLDRAMVFQDATLLPWATALENAAFGLKQRGVPKKQREELARESLETVGLGHRAAALPHEMSGGMRQRVGIARSAPWTRSPAARSRMSWRASGTRTGRRSSSSHTAWKRPSTLRTAFW
jgi:NitT/TauT family transport system ATP-binding protein